MIRLFPALAEPAFRLLWVGLLPSMLAVQMGMVAIGFTAFALSGSAAVLGGVSLSVGLPMLLLSLVGGVVADRASRRLVLLCSQGVLGVGVLATAALAASGHLAVWHLYVLAFSQGAAFSFYMPARQALVAEMVAPQHLRSAVTLNNAGMNLTRVAGPSLAGGLIAVPAIGIGGAFASMAAMYGVVLLSLVRLPERRIRERSPETGGWAQLVEGLRYIRSTPAVLVLLTLGFVPLFFGLPFQSLLPVFAERVHGVGALGLGLMNAAVGAGALAGSLVVALLAGTGRLGALQIALGIGFGLALIGFGLAPSFAAAIGLLAVVGFMSAGYGALNQTLVAVSAAPAFQGRVFSVYLLSFGLMPIATFPEAWLADHIGGPAVLALAGGAVAASVLVTALLVPTYRRPEPLTPRLS